MATNRATTRTRRRRNETPVTFTPEQANRSLVLVRGIVGEIVACYRQLTELKRHRGSVTRVPLSREVRDDILTRMQHCVDELNRLHQELSDVGCVLKDWRTGLVDFPAVRAGRRVWLCWRLGEAEVAYWHELSEGFAARKPVDGAFSAHAPYAA